MVTVKKSHNAQLTLVIIHRWGAHRVGSSRLQPVIIAVERAIALILLIRREIRHMARNHDTMLKKYDCL